MKNLSIFFLMLVFVLQAGFATAQTPAQNKETARKILAAVDAGDLNQFAMYVSPSLVEHMSPPPGMPKAASDFEMVKMIITGFHMAFPDGKSTIKNIAADGDLVIVHSVYTGTNKGDFMGMPATNKSVSLDQVDIIRFDSAGKGVEHWAVMNELAMLQQLGLIPAGGK